MCYTMILFIAYVTTQARPAYTNDINITWHYPLLLMCPLTQTHSQCLSFKYAKVNGYLSLLTPNKSVPFEVHYKITAHVKAIKSQYNRTNNTNITARVSDAFQQPVASRVQYWWQYIELDLNISITLVIRIIKDWLPDSEEE